MSKQLNNEDCTIIAGPCSIDDNNLKEVFRIADMEVKNRNGKMQRAIAGTRIVGLKSRTEYSGDGSGMGMDCTAVQKNIDIIAEGGCVSDFEITPSALIAEQVVKKTQMLVATEIMLPSIQLPSYENRIPKNKLMPWNPSVNQLGWQILELAKFAKTNSWHIGIKNGKWVGESVHIANSVHFTGVTTMEKTWAGLASYAGKLPGDIILIHRGVDAPDKGNYRNFPVHNIALRTKKMTGVKLFFDPSHAYGPKMKEDIVPAVIEAMKMELSGNEYLYDGVLIEVGTSKTDTKQHITLNELETLINELSKFRDLVSPSAL